MNWMIDTAHTQIQFSVRHMMISKVRGNFEKYSGKINLDEKNPAATSLEVQIETSSVNTREPQRDAHLRSADFFKSDEFPYMTFKSNRVEVHDGNRAKLIGDLTILDVTHEVAMDVEFLGKAKSPWGGTSAGFSAVTKINRKDWNLVWNQALETGGVLVGEDVEISIELEVVQQPE